MLCRAGVAHDNILKVLISKCRKTCISMLSLYGRLFRTIYPMSSRESKEGALRITYPETESYTEALQLANIPSLKRTSLLRSRF